VITLEEVEWDPPAAVRAQSTARDRRRAPAEPASPPRSAAEPRTESRTGSHPGSPLIQIRHLYIRKTEYTCIVGPNGAGKTVLLHLLAGLRAPTAGKITFENPDKSEGPPALGLVFQSPDDQIVGSTVERDLAFGLENRALPSLEIRRRVDQALEWSGLVPVAQRPPHLLSDGEKQRLALASAMILEPSLLLLDEPTARLDPEGRRRFLEEVRRERERTGATVVHVTHRSEQVMTADRVVGLRGGRVVFVGSPGELLRSPETDRLGILWSGLHRFRREAGARGLSLPNPEGEGWNDPAPLVESIARTRGAGP
jgi:energy-coupling factor transporter ATP-binding protein EcfA2